MKFTIWGFETDNTVELNSLIIFYNRHQQQPSVVPRPSHHPSHFRAPPAQSLAAPICCLRAFASPGCKWNHAPCGSPASPSVSLAHHAEARTTASLPPWRALFESVTGGTGRPLSIHPLMGRLHGPRLLAGVDIEHKFSLPLLFAVLQRGVHTLVPCFFFSVLGTEPLRAFTLKYLFGPFILRRGLAKWLSCPG